VTRFGRALRNLAERFAGRYYEGPAAPQRLAEMAVYFAQENPRATRKDWVVFAARLAEESYRSGYVRGVEYAEREERPAWKRGVSPEDLADELDPSWRDFAWNPEAVVEEPGEVVPEVYDSGATVQARMVLGARAKR
jgi:hypothetical protein